MHNASIFFRIKIVWIQNVKTLKFYKNCIVIVFYNIQSKHRFKSKGGYFHYEQ